MTTVNPARQRSSVLVAGLVAVVMLAGVLVSWAVDGSKADRGFIGAFGAWAMVLAGLVVAAGATLLVYFAPRLPVGVRWGLGLLVAVANGGVAVLALGSLFAPRDGSDVGFGMLLALAVIGLNVLAAQVARRPSRATG